LHNSFAATIHDDGSDFSKTISAIEELPYNIKAVLAGSELAIELADKLSHALGCRSNGPETSSLRCDKFEMGEAVRRSHTRAVKQARVQRWDQIQTFLMDHSPTPFKVVIKPIRSGGSDQKKSKVSLCESEEELKKCMGEIGGTAVVQEYLDGKEYVIDTVSRDGNHKLSAMWCYDKRPANGAKFVNFGMQSVNPNSAEGLYLFEYIKKCLTALGIQHGPGHAKVIDTITGPVLVDCGACPHGAKGTFIPLSDLCFDRNQVAMTVDAYMENSRRFEMPEDIPPASVCKLAGFKVDLVSVATGTLIEVNSDIERRCMQRKSFQSFDMMPVPGDHIPVTIDCFTAVGSISLCDFNRAQVEADHAYIRSIEKDLFTLSPTPAPMPPPAASPPSFSSTPATATVAAPAPATATVAPAAAPRREAKDEFPPV